MKPHDCSKIKKVPTPEVGMGRATPVTAGPMAKLKTSGITMRGAGAATKGKISRGPMA